MQITEVRVKLMEDPEGRLQAFCSVTFDDAFVVRDLKIIAGTSGPFVAMPSRKLSAHCSGCGCKNHARAAYCNQCGLRQKEHRLKSNPDGSRAKLYADIAHPINSACREMLQNAVVSAFEKERQLATQPDYVSRYDDVMDYGELVKSRKIDQTTAGGDTPERENPDRPNNPPTNKRKDPVEPAHESRPLTVRSKPQNQNTAARRNKGDGIGNGAP